MAADTPPDGRTPPNTTGGVIGDVRAFLLHRPDISTWIATPGGQVREDYSLRILQRVGIDVTSHSVLNLHRIGIEAPVRYVFEELLAWDGHSSCWPNHIATVERTDERIDKILIRPLGLSGVQWRRMKGWKIPPLFELEALRIQQVPGHTDPDNGRFLLFSCKGGYPIGIFVYYIRSSIPAEGEKEMTQIFLGVSFDFYGKKSWLLLHPVHRIWELIHNRVTANVLNRFKQFCEWRFARTGRDLSRSEKAPAHRSE